MVNVGISLWSRNLSGTCKLLVALRICVRVDVSVGGGEGECGDFTTGFRSVWCVHSKMGYTSVCMHVVVEFAYVDECVGGWSCGRALCIHWQVEGCGCAYMCVRMCVRAYGCGCECTYMHVMVSMRLCMQVFAFLKHCLHHTIVFATCQA